LRRNLLKKDVKIVTMTVVSCRLSSAQRQTVKINWMVYFWVQ